MVADYFDALFQYWEENAFARLNADFIDFLMKMYPYRDFTPDMARYMTGIANPQEIMAEIVDVGSFVTRTGQNTFSFREEVITILDSRRNAYFTDAESKNNYGYPIVSLSTTSISGEDHIVFNASLPMRYDGYDNRSCMAILDYDGSSLREVYSDDLTYDNGAYRMRYASATDGDRSLSV
ncbi:MAG: hypothetical protein UIH27_17855 [Ruminococcus sp.]|nr:hypothetical protein [Ruminococcus sp.]